MNHRIGRFLEVYDHDLFLVLTGPGGEGSIVALTDVVLRYHHQRGWGLPSVTEEDLKLHKRLEALRTEAGLPARGETFYLVVLDD